MDNKKIFVKKNYLPKTKTKNVYIRLSRQEKNKTKTAVIKKEIAINMKVEELFWQRVKQEAENKEMYISSFIKYCIIKELQKSDENTFFIDQHSINELLFQIKKIGVNINQIAKKINQGEIKQQNFDEFADAFNKLENQVQDFGNGVRVIK